MWEIDKDKEDKVLLDHHLVSNKLMKSQWWI
jgi:hypothetical protein